MRSTKVISEEIDEVERTFNREANIAKSTIALAKAEGRDLTNLETQTFDAAVKVATAHKENLRNLRVELIEAEQRNNQILAASQYGRESQRGNYMQTPNNLSPSMPALTLPVNGVLPGEGKRYPQFHRTGRLSAFANEQLAFDCGQWLKAVATRLIHQAVDARAERYCESVGLEIVNAGYEGSGPSGGYVVPAPASSTLIAVREKVGVSRKVCRVLPMSSDTLTIPRRTAGLTVYAPGEAGTITDSDTTLAQVQLIAKKRAVLSYISQELNDDALISMADFIFEEMGHALALQEDKELVNGTGAATSYFGVRGLLNRIGAAGVSTAATGHDTWPEIDMGDMSACVGLLADKYHEFPCSWLCSSAFYHAVMARLSYAGGGVTASEIFQGTGNVKSFMGYPVYITSQMPTSTATATVCALFGAFGEAVVMGDRGGISLAKSDDYRFVNDQVSLRAISRYDFNVFNPGDASTVGAYVALKTAS